MFICNFQTTLLIAAILMLQWWIWWLFLLFFVRVHLTQNLLINNARVENRCRVISLVLINTFLYIVVDSSECFSRRFCPMAWLNLKTAAQIWVHCQEFPSWSCWVLCACWWQWLLLLAIDSLFLFRAWPFNSDACCKCIVLSELTLDFILGIRWRLAIMTNSVSLWFGSSQLILFIQIGKRCWSF